MIWGCSFHKTIQTGDKVHIVYTGSFENQKILETNDITVTIWSGEILSGIENALIGMKTDENKTITILPKDWYGAEYKTNKLQKISKILFDKITANSANTGEINLGWITGSVKWTEIDEFGNPVILFDMNEAKTWQPLEYNISVTEISPSK